MEFQNRAQAVGRRWDHCADGYDAVVEEERQSQADCWLQLLQAHAPVASGRVLDVGTGPGFFAILMAKAGWQSVGIDCSAAMVETAARHARKEGVDAVFQQEDIHATSFPAASFDYIICRNVTWILYDPEKAFRECFRLLKPGGRLLYLDANWFYVKDEADRAARERDEAAYRRLYGAPVDTYRGDAATERAFQQTLFFNHIDRPRWDQQHLPQFGFTHVQVTPRLNEAVYDAKYQLLFRSIPLFMVTADKEETNGR